MFSVSPSNWCNAQSLHCGGGSVGHGIELLFYTVRLTRVRAEPGMHRQRMNYERSWARPQRGNKREAHGIPQPDRKSGTLRP